MCLCRGFVLGRSSMQGIQPKYLVSIISGSSLIRNTSHDVTMTADTTATVMLLCRYAVIWCPMNRHINFGVIVIDWVTMCDYSTAPSRGHAGTRVKVIFICYFLPLPRVVMTHLALLRNSARAWTVLSAAVE